MTDRLRLKPVPHTDAKIQRQFPSSFSWLIEAVGRRRRLAAGQILVQENDPFRNYFVVENGMLTQQSPTAGRAVLRAGDVFSGNCADCCAFSIQARATSNVVCIDRRAIEARLAEDAELRNFVRDIHARELAIITAATFPTPQPRHGHPPAGAHCDDTRAGFVD